MNKTGIRPPPFKPVTVVIPGNPVPMGRPRVNPNGGVIIPAKTIAAELEIAQLTKVALMSHPEEFPQRGAFRLELRFHEGPKGASTQADIDNCGKTVLDALNEIVYFDDRQVEVLNQTIERGSSEPRTEITIVKIC